MKKLWRGVYGNICTITISLGFFVGMLLIGILGWMTIDSIDTFHDHVVAKVQISSDRR
jgi:hypothetical protein